MIIQCSACHARYRINFNIKEKKTNTVFKCMNCGHKWRVQSDFSSGNDNENLKKEGNDVEESTKLNIVPANIHASLTNAPIYNNNVFRDTTSPMISENKDTHGGLLLFAYNEINKFFSSIIKKIESIGAALFLTFVLSAFLLFFFNEEMPRGLKSFLSDIPFFDRIVMSRSSGMRFEKMRVIKEKYKSDNSIVIKGYIMNSSNKDLIMPIIRICVVVKDAECAKVYYSPSNGKIIESNSKDPFEYRIISPPDDTKKVIVDMGSKIELMLR